MSFKEVNELRKSGKLEQALKMALLDFELLQKESVQELNPTSSDVDLMKIQGMTFQRFDNKFSALWAKRALAWVYYEYLKINCKPEKYSSFKDYLNKIKELQLPQDEKMVFDSCVWQVGRIIYALQKQENIDFKKINEIFEIIKDFHFTKPSEGYSYLYKAFHTLNENWDKYLDFADWWDFENFRSEDYLNEEFNGRQIMSIVERAYIAYAKNLLSIKVTSGKSRIIATI